MHVSATEPAPAGPAPVPPPRSRLLPTRDELREMGRLALPVVVVQVGIMLLGVVDTVMVGRVGARVLAAVAVGNLYFFVCSIFGLGVLLALDPVVAQAVGAGDRPAIGRALQRGFVVALLMSVVVGLALLGAGPVLRAARQPAEILADARAYALASIPGLPAFFAFVVFRQTMQAMRHMKPIVVTIVAMNLANVFLNWVFIYGNLGAPPLGAIGSAWASTASRWFGAIAILVASLPYLREHLVPFRREAFAPAPLGRMLRLGVPIGLQQMLESGAFGAIGLLMGVFGTVEVASHQVAINLASLTFMVPLAVGAAASVMVGHAVGAGDARAAQRAALAAFLIGVGFMCLSAGVFLTVPEQLARLYTSDAAVLALASTLIPIAGIFQLADGVQAVAAGVLRGAGDTRAPLVFILLGFWLLGTPVSLYLAFRTPAGPVGLWWGLVIGLGAVAIGLSIRTRRKLRGELRRVVV
ncbi:MAG TPA: MATE family efflux transporter [Gemmatimonadaceae bacterium]|nr:MATE family efflux transporter [Gemmatimonadaceae bacterium]